MKCDSCVCKKVCIVLDGMILRFGEQFTKRIENCKDYHAKVTKV